MTVLSLDDRPAVWFIMEGGGRVRMRPVTPEAMRDIRRQTTTRKVEYQKVDGVATRFPYEEIDEDMQNELLWDHIIMEWEGMTDGKGAEVPCTKENKVRAMLRDKRFAAFFNDSLRAMMADDQAALEASEKN